MCPCNLCVCVWLYQTVTAGSSSQEKSSESEPNGPVEQEKNHSNSSTLSDRRGSNSSLCSIEEEHRSVYDMVQCILLSTRDNVNFVNEVFHQVRRNTDLTRISVKCSGCSVGVRLVVLYCCHLVVKLH